MISKELLVLLENLKKVAEELPKELKKNVEKMYENISPESGAEYLKEFEKLKKMADETSETINKVKESRENGN